MKLLSLLADKGGSPHFFSQNGRRAVDWQGGQKYSDRAETFIEMSQHAILQAPKFVES